MSPKCTKTSKYVCVIVLSVALCLLAMGTLGWLGVYWFLLGPVITIEWLRRGKKLSCMSGSRGRPETPVESGPNIVADHEVTRGETMPLLPYTDVPRNGHSRLIAVRRILSYLREGKLAVGCGYVILTVVALPVGISGGGGMVFFSI